MTDKELRRLSRTELFELLLYFKNESDKLKEENEALKAEVGTLRIVRDELAQVLDTVRETSEIIKHLRVKWSDGKKSRADDE